MNATKLFIGLSLLSGSLLSQGVFAAETPDDKAKPAEEVKAAAESKPAEEKQPATKVDPAKIGYSLGIIFAKNLKNDYPELNIENFLKGFADSFHDKPMMLTDAEISDSLDAYEKQRHEAFKKQQEKMQQLAEENKTVSEQYLKDNAKKDGVTTTKSGLQYKVITKGNGKKPSATDSVTVHYKGTLIDGTEFDSSYKRGEPVTFPLQSVIPGWTEALQLMNEGAKYQLFIPSDLAYGTGGTGNIKPNSTLVFDVELIKVDSKSDSQPK